MAIEKTEFTFPDETQGKDDKETEDKFEVEIQDDTPPADRGRKPMETAPAEPTEEELQAYSDSARNRIKHFSKGYHEERRAKEAALRERDELQKVAKAIVDENKALRGSLVEGNTALVEQAKLTVKGDVEAARKKLKEAQDAFDSDAIAEAQEALMAAKIRQDKLDSYRPAPLQAKENEVQIDKPAKQPPDPKLTGWMDRNKWFGNDSDMTALAYGVHDRLEQQGVPLGSDEYYTMLEAEVKKRFPEKFEDSGSGASSQKPKSNIVATATRSTAPKKIVLTQTQVAIAKRLNVPLELYARKVAEMERNQ